MGHPCRLVSVRFVPKKKRFTTPIFFVDKLLILWGGLSLKGRGFRGVFVGKWLIPLGRLRF